METIIASVIAALITGAVTLGGVLVSNGKRQAVLETKIDHLTHEVQKHNNFAQRMPVVEQQIKALEARMKKVEEAIMK